MGVDLPDLPGEDDPRAAAVRFGFGFDTSGEDINSRLQLPWMTLQWRRALATLFLCIVSRPSPTNHSGFRDRLTSSAEATAITMVMVRLSCAASFSFTSGICFLQVLGYGRACVEAGLGGFLGQSAELLYPGAI
nr:hypothetical protein Iba_chr13bCG13580 [Ipomoea batatas]